jgi:hypothetical protein
MGILELILEHNPNPVSFRRRLLMCFTSTLLVNVCPGHGGRILHRPQKSRSRIAPLACTRRWRDDLAVATATATALTAHPQSWCIASPMRIPASQRSYGADKP